MAVLKFVLLKNRQKSSGKFGIYIYLTFNHEVRYISTEFEVDDESQFENGKVCYRKDASILNKRMEFVLNGYKERMARLDLKKFSTCAQLKSMLTKADNTEISLTVQELFERRIERLQEEGRKSYADMNRYTCQVVTSILGNPPIEYLTRTDIKGILLKGMQRRGYAKGNIQMRMTHFKAALNEAIDEGLVKYDEHPFKGFTMPQSDAKLMDITVEQFQKIRDLNPSEYKLKIARDMFLLSFYLGGINLADLVRADLKGPTLRYERKKSADHKTGNKATVLTIPEEVRPIIHRLNKESILKVKTETEYKNLQRYINKCFSELAKKVGIKTSFSFYAGRKTFAQFAFMIGIKTEIIEYCVGQSVKKNRPIYNYVRVMQRQADVAVRKVIDYTVSPDAFQLYDVV